MYRSPLQISTISGQIGLTVVLLLSGNNLTKTSHQRHHNLWKLLSSYLFDWMIESINQYINQSLPSQWLTWNKLQRHARMPTPSNPTRWRETNGEHIIVITSIHSFNSTSQMLGQVCNDRAYSSFHWHNYKRDSKIVITTAIITIIVIIIIG